MRVKIGGVGQWFIARPRRALVLALVVEIVIFVCSRQDMPPDDPLYYAEYAHAIADDPAAAFAVQSIHPWHMRIGLTIPLAGLYCTFGVSAFVTNLLSLVAGLGVLLVLYAAVRTPRAKVLAMLFGVACWPLARHAATLNIDLPCAALIACSILWLSWRDRPSGSRWVVAAAGAWFAAFLVKETAVWCVPVWCYAIVCDLRVASWRRVARTFAPAVVVGLALAMGYLALCVPLG